MYRGLAHVFLYVSSCYSLLLSSPVSSTCSPVIVYCTPITGADSGSSLLYRFLFFHTAIFYLHEELTRLRTRIVLLSSYQELVTIQCIAAGCICRSAEFNPRTRTQSG